MSFLGMKCGFYDLGYGFAVVCNSRVVKFHTTWLPLTPKAWRYVLRKVGLCR